MGPLIIKMFVTHYSVTNPTKIVRNYDVGVPIGGIVLAVTAVSTYYLKVQSSILNNY